MSLLIFVAKFASLAADFEPGSPKKWQTSLSRIAKKEAPTLKHGTRVLVLAWALIGKITVEAQHPAAALQPSLEHKKLGVFVGMWQDEAEMKPGPLGPGGRMSLTETCEWFAGGFSVVCHTEILTFGGDLKTLTVLTYDPEEKVYSFYEFNSVGGSDSAKGTVNGDTWAFAGESKMGGRLIRTRSTITLPSPDSAMMKSEVSVDGGPWTLMMELNGSRVKQSLTDYNPCAHASEGWPFECFQKCLGPH